MLGTFLRKHLKTYCLCNCFGSIHLDWLQLLNFATCLLNNQHQQNK